MIEMLTNPLYFWLFFGLFLKVAEFLIPSFFIIFFGVGSWITAIVVGVFPEAPLWLLLLVFLVSSIGLLMLLRQKLAPIFKGDEEVETKNDNIGIDAEVVEEITPVRRGKIKMQGTTWAATAEMTIAVGEVVSVVSAIPNEPMSYIVAPK